jgi:predicted O-methyltransferase YrrM
MILLPRGPFSHYLNQRETSLLVDLIGSVSPRVVIEFGCNLGITASRILENVGSIERYIGIDVPSGYETVLECQRSEVPDRAGRYAMHDSRFYLLLQPSLTIEQYDLEMCDAVFIDGDHSEKAVLHESRLARALVRPGGMICWHDYNNTAVEVTQALNSLIGEGWKIESIPNSWLAFMRISA